MDRPRRRVPDADGPVVHCLSAEELRDASYADRPTALKAAGAEAMTRVESGRLRLPMLPEAATKAMQLASNPGVAIRDIERVLRGDPLIAARVLAVANSAAYGGTQVRTLNAALSRLGTGSVRDVLYQAVSDAHIFRGGRGTALERERTHAAAVGEITRDICKQIGFDSAYAFVCGLLHDIGKPIGHQLLTGLDLSTYALKPSDTRAVVDEIHGELGARLARAWQLPALVTEACRRHHGYQAEHTGGQAYSQIGNVVAAADRIAEHVGAGRKPRPVNLQEDAVFFQLGLTPPDVMRIIASASEARAAA